MQWQALFYDRKIFYLQPWIVKIKIIKFSSVDHVKLELFTNLNVTSLNSGLFTNFGSMREPLIGCKTVSLIGLIGSHPKQVLNISARRRVVPSFCKNKLWGILKLVPNIKLSETHLAVPKNIEEQWQTFHYKLLTIIIRTDLQKVLQ